MHNSFGDSSDMNRPEKPPYPATGWVVTGGHAGHKLPCVGIVEAIGITPKVIDVAPSAPWRFLAPYGPAGPNAEIAAPWPDLVVVSGRQSIPFARRIRRRSRGRTFVAVLQNPVVPASHFDLVWVNEHDSLDGGNVVRTLTTPSRMTDRRLDEGSRELRRRAPQLTDKVLGVVIGGTSRFYKFGRRQARCLAADLTAFAGKYGYSIAVTPSRRTGKKNMDVVRDGLSGVSSWVWDGSGENPYFGILGIADRLVVTCDSVNMLGEAAFTGKPLQAYRIPGESAKIGTFHADLIARDAMRWFDGSCPDWHYERLDATRFVADEILKRYAMRAQPNATP